MLGGGGCCRVPGALRGQSWRNARAQRPGHGQRNPLPTPAHHPLPGPTPFLKPQLPHAPARCGSLLLGTGQRAHGGQLQQVLPSSLCPRPRTCVLPRRARAPSAHSYRQPAFMAAFPSPMTVPESDAASSPLHAPTAGAPRSCVLLSSGPGHSFSADCVHPGRAAPPVRTGDGAGCPGPGTSARCSSRRSGVQDGAWRLTE